MTILQHKCILCSHCSAICPEGAVTIEKETGEEFSSLNEGFPDNLRHLIKMRRSIRFYKNDPISREVINNIVNTVNHAPTGTNSRGVGMTILDSREKVNELTDILMSHFDMITRILLNFITYPFLVLILGKVKTGKLFSYKKLISKYWEGDNILTYNAPLLMIFHAHRKSSAPAQDGVIWATTAMYYTESMGIGTCFNGFMVIGINTCRKARKFLKLKRNQKIYETFTAGYPRFSYKRSAVRTDLNVTFI
ncbi:MAG: nitroreductase family protein [Spirochaetaceae bacterium]|nr:nitroreductase family protein [Spirochaetaceae bacterium]